MQPLEVPFGETWSVLRGARNSVGDKTPAVVATLTRCVYWQHQPTEPIGVYPTTARDSSSLLGTLAVPRVSAEVKPTDQLRRESTGVTYRVVGNPQFDHVHPLTGWDTGYKTLTVTAVI